MTTAIEETKTAADLRLDLAEAQEALSPAAAAVADARAGYQTALDLEAAGRAEAGSSLVARQALADAEHAEDLAKAKVRVLERELHQATEREGAARAQEIAGEIARLDAEADDLSVRLRTAAEDLLALLDEAGDVNNAGIRLTTELTELNAAGIGRDVRKYSRRRAAFSITFRNRLTPLLEHRGAPQETARFAV